MVEDKERLERLRKKLYQRATDDESVGRHDLSSDKSQLVSDKWSNVYDDRENNQHKVGQTEDVRGEVSRRVDYTEDHGTSIYASNTPQQDSGIASSFDVLPEKPKRTYRLKIILASLFVFAGVLVFSIFIFLSGSNGEISSRNIDISIDAPRSIGSGEVVPIKVLVHNKNPVPIEFASIIVEYPTGTRPVEGGSRALNTERIRIPNIGVNERHEEEMQVVIFGEEDEVKDIRFSFEYRIQGTNSILQQDMDTIALRMTSAPLVVLVDATERVSAGQETDILVRVRSNASAPLRNVLLTAQYPGAFDFTESNPAPSARRNTWRINEINPGEVQEVAIRGAFTGGQDDEFVIDFSAGMPREDNEFILDTIFSSVRSEFTIEQPFIDVKIAAAGQSGRTVTLNSDQQIEFKIDVLNTLNQPVYDMSIDVALEGNGVNPDRVQSLRGFFDSVDGVVRFNVTTDSDLSQIRAGSSRSLTFRTTPRDVQTSQMDLRVNVMARRIQDASATEQLVGTASMAVQFSSNINAAARLNHISGPVPPIAEQETTYAITLDAIAGANDLTDTVVTATLPTYVRWLDSYEGPGSVTYNPSNQEITWNVGSVSADITEQLTFNVVFRPSRTQARSSPILLNRQFIRATDRFTGTVVRGEGSAINTELSRDLGFERGDSLVQPIGN